MLFLSFVITIELNLSIQTPENGYDTNEHLTVILHAALFHHLNGHLT